MERINQTEGGNKKTGSRDGGETARLAVLFPGLGYTCDKPLLYYSSKLAVKHGYRVVPVGYAGFPANVKGDAAKMRECFLMAMEQTAGILRDMKWDAYTDIVFIGKSIGTAVAARFAGDQGIHARGILFTPLEETFPYSCGPAIAFHGTADPWAKDEPVESACRAAGIPLYLTEGANHSLETGDIRRDIEIMGTVMERVEHFLR